MMNGDVRGEIGIRGIPFTKELRELGFVE